MSAVTRCIARVRTVEEFLAAVDTAAHVLCDTNQNCELWYRGQVQTGFQLMPSISRSIEGIPLNPELEIVFLSKFKSGHSVYRPPANTSLTQWCRILLELVISDAAFWCADPSSRLVS